MKKTIIIIGVILAICIGYFLYKKPNIDIIPTDKSNLIVVASPIKNAEISSPLTISGRARGSWFFEGSFPIILMDSYGNTVAEGHTIAQGEWMTEDFVGFLGNLQFDNFIKGSKGKLVLKKDNPSGLPENDDFVEIPVTFK